MMAVGSVTRILPAAAHGMGSLRLIAAASTAPEKLPTAQAYAIQREGPGRYVVTCTLHPHATILTNTRDAAYRLGGSKVFCHSCRYENWKKLPGKKRYVETFKHQLELDL
jgi:hypothetical protein